MSAGLTSLMSKFVRIIYEWHLKREQINHESVSYRQQRWKVLEKNTVVVHRKKYKMTQSGTIGGSLDFLNPVFSSYAFWSSILVIKCLLMSPLTAIFRFQNKVRTCRTELKKQLKPYTMVDFSYIFKGSSKCWRCTNGQEVWFTQWIQTKCLWSRCRTCTAVSSNFI